MSKLYRNGGAKGQAIMNEEMLLFQHGEIGKIPLTGAGSFESINVIDDSVSQLTVPANAGCCTIMVESDGGEADSNKVIRFKEADNPTVAEGFFLGNGDIMEISKDIMSTIRFIATEDVVIHKILVQYYLSIEQDVDA